MWLSIVVRLILLVVLWIVATILLQKLLLVFHEHIRLCYVTCNRGETDIEEAFSSFDGTD